MAPKIKYCCDPAIYEDYYVNQAGSGLPGFQGSRYQRGAGLGSIFTGLMKFVAPLLKKGAVALGKFALNKAVEHGTSYLGNMAKPSGIKGRAPKKTVSSASKRRRATSKGIF